tara:strand:+ start:1406 stop:1564 length:159 start_codon:yes stop_codon:yes gene_type:complete
MIVPPASLAGLASLAGRLAGLAVILPSHAEGSHHQAHLEIKYLNYLKAQFTN